MFLFKQYPLTEHVILEKQMETLESFGHFEKRFDSGTKGRHNEYPEVAILTWSVVCSSVFSFGRGRNRWSVTTLEECVC